MILIVLLVLLSIIAWYHLIRPLNHFNRIGVKQTNNPWPILGDQWPVILRKTTRCDLSLRIYNLHSKCRYVGFYLFTKPTLILRDPELIKELTVKEFDHFTDHRTLVDPEVDPVWASNLMALKGSKWREMRATLSASFTGSKMKYMFDTINEAAESFVQHFLKKQDDIIEIEAKDIFTRYTNDVIASAAFGLKVDSLGQPSNTFYMTGQRLTDLSGIKIMLKAGLFSTFPKVFKAFKISLFKPDLVNYFRYIIRDNIQTRAEKNIVRKDMINLLMEARNGIKLHMEAATEGEKSRRKQLKQLTNDDIAAQALVFFFAGFDTVSTALSFGMYELTINPEVQRKLREEIEETRAANNGEITYETLLRMKYMDNVYSEILRKWPPGATMDRVCTRPYTILPKYKDEKPVHLKVGDIFLMPIFPLHRNPKYFPNPEKFDPERFSDENKDKIVPYTYIPFGSGPRSCIGSRFAVLEAKAVLYHLLSHFELVPIDKTSIPLKLIKGNFQLKAESGIWLGLKTLRK